MNLALQRALQPGSHMWTVLTVGLWMSAAYHKIPVISRLFSCFLPEISVTCGLCTSPEHPVLFPLINYSLTLYQLVLPVARFVIKLSFKTRTWTQWVIKNLLAEMIKYADSLWSLFLKPLYYLFNTNDLYN